MNNNCLELQLDNFYIRLMAKHPQNIKLDFIEDSKNDMNGFENYLGSFYEFIEEK